MAASHRLCHAGDDTVAAVALGLAAIAALTGQIGRARELVRLAAQHGLPMASTYAAALLDRDSPDRTEALHTLGHRPDDTDALNFLGNPARADGCLTPRPSHVTNPLRELRRSACAHVLERPGRPARESAP